MIWNPSMNSNWSYSPETLNSGQNWWFFVPCDLEIWWMTLDKNRTPLPYYTKLCSSFQSHGWIHTGITPRKHSIRVKIGAFCPVWPWNLTDDLKNNRVPLLYYMKLCASFQSHGWIQTGVTVRKWSIRVKIDDFLSRVTLKFDGWSWKTKGHLFCVALNFVYHFIAISEFKLDKIR